MAIDNLQNQNAQKFYLVKKKSGHSDAVVVQEIFNKLSGIVIEEPSQIEAKLATPEKSVLEKTLESKSCMTISCFFLMEIVYFSGCIYDFNHLIKLF